VLVGNIVHKAAELSGKLGHDVCLSSHFTALLSACFWVIFGVSGMGLHRKMAWLLLLKLDSVQGQQSLPGVDTTRWPAAAIALLSAGPLAAVSAVTRMSTPQCWATS
jgi:hypothetical protein